MTVLEATLWSEEIRQATDSSGLLEAPAALRQELAVSGYLLLRGFLPREEVQALEAEVRRCLLDAGQLDRELAFHSKRDPVNDRAILRTVFRIQALHELAHRPRVMELMQLLLDAELPFVHPKPVCRVVAPGGENAVGTPSHQDHLGMQGSTRACTTWLPLTSCPRLHGPIAIAAGSHLKGLRPYRPCRGALVAACDDSDLAGSCVSADLEPGDVIVFTSLTVHRTLPNQGEVERLSVDFRFQPRDEPICEVSLREVSDLPWEEVYRSWGDSPLRYFWREMDLNVIPFDPAPLHPGQSLGRPTAATLHGS